MTVPGQHASWFCCGSQLATLPSWLSPAFSFLDMIGDSLGPVPLWIKPCHSISNHSLFISVLVMGVLWYSGFHNVFSLQSFWKKSFFSCLSLTHGVHPPWWNGNVLSSTWTHVPCSHCLCRFNNYKTQVTNLVVSSPFPSPKHLL